MKYTHVNKQQGATLAFTQSVAHANVAELAALGGTVLYSTFLVSISMVHRPSALHAPRNFSSDASNSAWEFIG